MHFSEFSIFQWVEQKEIVQDIKWSGLLPISSFGWRRCTGVTTGRALCACLHNMAVALVAAYTTMKARAQDRGLSE